MRAHDRGVEGGREMGPKAVRVESEGRDLRYRTAVAGQMDVLGPAGLLGLQRAVGNAAVSALMSQKARCPVRDVVGSGGGSPLDTDTGADMESRLGHDFGDVRVHTDSRARDSATAVNAHPYTVGSNVVFQRDEYDPSVTEGKTMLGYELTHVVQQGSGPVEGTPTEGGVQISDPSDRSEQEAAANAERVMSAPAPGLQQERGNAFVQRLIAQTRGSSPAMIQRDVIKDARHNPTAFEFRVGIELTQDFVTLAKTLTTRGAIGAAGLRKLRDHALTLRGTVGDNERMFMAGLLDAANARTFQRTTVSPTAKVAFSITSLSTARLRQVIDLDRKKAPTSVTGPLGQAETKWRAHDVLGALGEAGKANAAAEAEILASAGSFQAQARSLIAYAKANGVWPAYVLQAMLAAASDNSEDDRVMAGVVFAVAAAAGHPLMADVAQGRIKVDALSSSDLARLLPRNTTVAGYAYFPQSSGLKGDTIYLSNATDIASIGDRSTIIHELQHAVQDKQASGPSFTTRPTDQVEAEAYRAQARYILDQMVGQSSAERAKSVADLAATPSAASVVPLILEGQSDLRTYRPILHQIMVGLPPPNQASPADVDKVLKVPAAALEKELLKEIRQSKQLQPGATTSFNGFQGESLINQL